MRLLRTFVSLLFISAIAAPLLTHAQTRSYEYDSFDVRYEIQENASVQVEENLTYSFHGAYHQGFRSLPHAGSDRITDIRLVDGATGQPLTKVSSKLDKTDPASWGKYTVYSDGGATNVEWYYDLADTTHTWKLIYTLHGAVSFYTNHDEFYWNLFLGLDAPVHQAKATLVLPKDTTTAPARWYVTGEHMTTVATPDAHTFVYTAQNFYAGEPATIVAGWQRGIVSKHAYWLDALGLYWPYLASILLFLGTIIYLICNWFFRLRIPANVIIAEYEPPKDMIPAEADLFVNGIMATRAMPATVVDLAIRGFLTIAQDSKKQSSARTVVRVLLVFIVVASFFGSFILPSGNPYPLLTVMVIAIGLFTLIPLVWSSGSSLGRVDYTLTRITALDRSQLRPYEQDVIDALFSSLESPLTFSTQALRKSRTNQMRMSSALQNARMTLLKETDDDTHAYVPGHTPARSVGGLAAFIAIPFIASLVLMISNVIPASFGSTAGYAVFIGVTLFCALLIVYQARFAIRLNDHGQELRTKLLGFKQYLYTAERFRLQNLTPDQFEKYLPYAMVFGVEKQWAKAFEGMTLLPPRWYAGSAGYMYAGGGGYTPVFSPTTFASSFSASFATSFSSSSGGFSGGGGGAGGGGGGGGGGAS